MRNSLKFLNTNQEMEYFWTVGWIQRNSTDFMKRTPCLWCPLISKCRNIFPLHSNEFFPLFNPVLCLQYLPETCQSFFLKWSKFINIGGLISLHYLKFQKDQKDFHPQNVVFTSIKLLNLKCSKIYITQTGQARQLFLWIFARNEMSRQ